MIRFYETTLVTLLSNQTASSTTVVSSASYQLKASHTGEYGLFDRNMNHITLPPPSTPVSRIPTERMFPSPLVELTILYTLLLHLSKVLIQPQSYSSQVSILAILCVIATTHPPPQTPQPNHPSLPRSHVCRSQALCRCLRRARYPSARLGSTEPAHDW